MKYGDKVRVINADSEYLGLTGTMGGLYLDGSVCVVLDLSGWEISFDPFDIEEIDYLTRLSVDGHTILPPAD
jgi:type IV secretory pathway VirB4 component